MSKTIGVIGTRKRDSQEDLEVVKKVFLSIFEKGDTICSGLCPQGGDRFAVTLANELELPKDKRLWFPAEWDKLDTPNARIKRNKWGQLYNANAGFTRNTDIARESDILIACVSMERTGGTEDTIRKFITSKGKGGLIIV